MKTKIKLLKKPTDDSIMIEFFKDKATVSIEKSLFSKTLLGRRRYVYRVVSKFIYAGQERVTTELVKGPMQAIKFAEANFIMRNRQTINELKKLKEVQHG